MESLVKNVRYMRYVLRAQATAADLWLIAICLVAAFGRSVPWYMWVLFGLESAAALLAISKACSDEDEDDDE